MKRSNKNRTAIWWIVFFAALPVIVTIIGLLSPLACPKEHDSPASESKEERYGSHNSEIFIIASQKTPGQKIKEEGACTQYQGSFSRVLSWICKWIGEPVAFFTYYILVVTFALALYTYWLWDSTSELVREAADTARKELRAYVALDDIYFRWNRSNPLDEYDRKDIVKSDPPQRPRIRVKNFGKTPASHMSIRLNGFMRKMNEPFDKWYVNRDYEPTRHALFPSQEFGTWTTELHPRFDPHDPYDSDDTALMVFGAITYVDIYKRWWITRFCYFYDGLNRFVPYTEYNYEKEYESEKKALESLSYV